MSMTSSSEDSDANSTIGRHFELAAAGVEPALRWAAGSPAEHADWSRTFSGRLKRLVGTLPPRVPLEVRWDEVVDLGTVVRRKIYVRSEAHYWVPAYYFVPKQVRDKTPAILCLHGHSGIVPYIREGDAAQRRKSRELDLDYAVHLAEHGYVTLAPVQRGWNETALPADQAKCTHSCHRVTMDAFLLGMTPVGLRCWDASRLLDFLETQEPVDRERIGVAGLSGGGTTGLFLAALEPRIVLAMIGGYYCTFRDSIFSIYHCICNCVPDMLRWGEMREIAAVFAPKPMLIIAGTRDEIFPIAATRRACRELAEVYELLGAPGNLDRDFFNGPHAWNHRKTVPFLRRHWGRL